MKRGTHIKGLSLCKWCEVAKELSLSTVRSPFETVRSTTIHFYDPCRVGPSTPELWLITFATQASFLYLVRF